MSLSPAPDSSVSSFLAAHVLVPVRVSFPESSQVSQLISAEVGLSPSEGMAFSQGTLDLKE